MKETSTGREHKRCPKTSATSWFIIFYFEEIIERKKNERRNERRTRICVYKPILFLNQSLLQRKERKRDQELKGKKVIFCEERLTSNVFQL
jgi:hypothetical protein